MYSPNETKNHPPLNKRDNNGVERTSTTAVTLFPRLVYSDLNQSGFWGSKFVCLKRIATQRKRVDDSSGYDLPAAAVWRPEELQELQV